MKRQRNTHDALDDYAAQLRQSVSRALERIQQPKRGKPIDRLVIAYCMHFLDCAALPPNHAIAQAQLLATASTLRVLQPSFFSVVDDGGIEHFLDQLISECTSQDVEDTLKELHSLQYAREMMSTAAEKDARTEEEFMLTTGETLTDDVVATGIANSSLYWDRCARFISAASIVSVSLRGYSLLPHHEQELQSVLQSVRKQDSVEFLTDLVADLHALSAIPMKPLSTAPLHAGAEKVQFEGVDRQFYTMLYSRANYILAQRMLSEFVEENQHAAPPLSVEQSQRLNEANEIRNQKRGDESAGGSLAGGLALDFVPDDRYLTNVLEADCEVLQQDEDLFKDEIHDYHIRKELGAVGTAEPNAQLSTTHTTGGGKTKNAITTTQSSVGADGLVKPHRYCKVKTGYHWTQYNRTHYDSKTNPPPKQVLWYEFTLLYPAIAKTKKRLDNMFRVENTDKGPDDDYCVIVFSAGPPYADVAYRIVRREWDKRNGGVRATFNDQGRFRLFFRFAGTVYRR